MNSSRSSLASLSKVMPKASPMKTGGAEEAKGGKSTPGSSRIGGVGATAGRIGGVTRTTAATAQSAKQQELAAKKEEM